jgi:hypothetical protein
MYGVSVRTLLGDLGDDDLLDQAVVVRVDRVER